MRRGTLHLDLAHRRPALLRRARHSGQSGAALGFCTGWLEIAVQPQVAQDAGEPQGQALLKDLVILPDFSLDLTGNFSGKHLIQF